MMTVPSPNGRWNSRPSPRAATRARTPSPTRISAASTNEKGPKVLTISSNAPTAATFCSKLTRLKIARARRLAGPTRESATLERLPARQAGVGPVPEGDLVLALLPAQVDLLAVADGGEVHEPALEVAQHHLAVAELHQAVAQGQERLRDHAARFAAAVRGTRLGQGLAGVGVAQLLAGGP